MDFGKVQDGLVGGDQARLDTVRVLHQTVVTLRLALEQSRAELNSLREQVKASIDPTLYTNTIENLSIENHVLRQKVLSSSEFQTLSADKILKMSAPYEKKEEDDSLENDVFESEGTKSEGINGEKADEKEDPSFKQEDEEDKLTSLSSCQQETPRVSKGDSEDSEEVDDIELIFTTDDTKELNTYQEDLVSIAETDGWQGKIHEHKEDDDIPANLRQTWSQSVLVETDISKCGVIDENEVPNHVNRRNTLAAPPPYRPIIHREPLSGSRGQLSDRPGVKFCDTGEETRSPRGVRPILIEKNSPKQECGAQTDITALPLHWKSESYLAHQRVSHNFTTLPSKFALPFGPQSNQRRQSLRLSEKTQEARRVLLSDINFTSMVPELSRSADHLCQESSSGLLSRYPRAFTYMKNPDGLISPGFLKWSPSSDCQAPWDCCYSSSSVHPSTLDITDTRRRHSMRPSVESYWNTLPHRPNWASVPSSPTHFHRSRSVPFSASYMRSTTPQSEASMSFSHTPRLHMHRHEKSQSSYALKSSKTSIRNKVKFSGCYPGQSLPDLRLPIDADEDSTDSLIDESEDFLRRSIDSMLSGSDPNHVSRRRSHSDYTQEGGGGQRRGEPFIARVPSDLRVDYWVKFIGDEGRVLVGRVRYVGPIPGRADPHVGIHLPQSQGNTDGTYASKRFFNCEENCGIFVPFKKVVMAWSL